MNKICSLLGFFALCSVYSTSVYAMDTPESPVSPAASEPELIIETEAETPDAKIEENTMVIIKTSKGDIKLELFDKEAPITVENFLKYAKDGHYNGTIFHRVINNFMIQGGGFKENMSQKPTRDQITNEANNGKKNNTGTIAMARTQVIDSATSQFFINTKDNDFLNFKDPSVRGYGYCVFGEVVDGMDVVRAIEKVQTGNKAGMGDVPTETIEILEVVEAPAAE